MGVSPWTASPLMAFSPEGTTGASYHSAPLGLRTGRLPRPTMGSRPMATTCRPVGTFGEFLSTKMHPEPGNPDPQIVTFSILTWRLPIFYLLPKS